MGPIGHKHRLYSWPATICHIDTICSGATICHIDISFLTLERIAAHGSQANNREPRTVDRGSSNYFFYYL